MTFEHRAWIIELYLLGIHYSNYPYNKKPEEALAIWKTVINGSESCATQTGNREDVLEKLKSYIDWRIDDPEMKNIF